MAVAITQFCGFCGFRPVEQITQFLSFVNEFDALVGPHLSESFRAAVSQPNPTTESIQACLKDVFSRVMSAPEEAVRREVQNLVERYERGQEKPVEKGVKELVLELNTQFPGDVGIFCTFMLNVVNLEAGQAVFLCANEPHAYIRGGKYES